MDTAMMIGKRARHSSQGMDGEKSKHFFLSYNKALAAFKFVTTEVWLLY